MPDHTSAHSLNNHELQKSKPALLVIAVLLAWAALARRRLFRSKRPCAQLLQFSAPGVEVSKAEPIPAKDSHYRRIVWYRARSINELGPEGSSLVLASN